MSLIRDTRRALLVTDPAYFALVGSSKASASTDLLQPTLPAGSVGDLGIADVGYASARTLTPPTGWTLTETWNQNSNIMSRYIKVLDGLEGATVDFGQDTASLISAIVSRWSGCDGTTPVDVDTAANDGLAGATVAAPSVTTTGRDRLIVVGWETSATRTITPLAPLEIIQQITATAPGMALGWTVARNPGATGAFTATISSAANTKGITSAFKRPG